MAANPAGIKSAFTAASRLAVHLARYTSSEPMAAGAVRRFKSQATAPAHALSR